MLTPPLRIEKLIIFGAVRRVALLRLRFDVRFQFCKYPHYSAAEHVLGPRILSENTNPQRRIFKLAGEFMWLKNAHTVPELIRGAQLKYLQIGVGSEISCMVNPKVCWVANTRTIWTHLLVKHSYNVNKADEELKLYRDADPSSQMAYKMWAQMHADLRDSLFQIAELGKTNARKVKVAFGAITYLWADAIESALYRMYHDLQDAA